ncbi:hypothetical protein DSL92_07795 [Billgrantia gudaonensis]|uniref:Uncharacterized protein n=1 Tax=Billgrantia gudaonensis TaxID=376427 RepID=A0A3S0R4N6_9GAMM|nr:hypothetical protein DSL92_07795 [Halomonas gudaonensis]
MRTDERTLDFDGLQGPLVRSASRVREAGSGEPRDARLAILEGQQPPVEFLGSRPLHRAGAGGRAELALAPGDYRLSVDAGAGFTAEQQELEVTHPATAVEENLRSSGSPVQRRSMVRR